MSNRTGSINVTANGRHRVRATLFGSRVTIGTFDTREEAEQVLSSINPVRRRSEFVASRYDSGVYFIQAGTDGPIKIGYADSIKGRLEQIQVCNAAEVRVVGVIRGADRGTEKALHALFVDARVRGEWFHPTAALRMRVAEVAAAYSAGVVIGPGHRPLGRRRSAA